MDLYTPNFIDYHRGKKTFYITTAIDYPNALPHIGTAFEKIGADVQARFMRFMGQEVFFLMGNDENTVKVLKAAQTDGYSSYKEMTIKAYADRMAEQFKEVWKALDISYDDFIQTSEERHRIGVQHFLQTVYDGGFIYKKPYAAWYCEGCEEFKLEKNLQDVDGKKICPNHPLSLVWREEENYFFKLSAFKQWILDLYVPAFDSAYTEILPESRLNEMENFVKGELDDISISRKNEGWGIPIPWDEGQVAYVWFDALLNYLTGIGFPDPKFQKYWPAAVHVIGKDITRFHCALWPAMLHAYNKTAKIRLAPPEKVFAHGFIYQKKGDEAVKVSKSGTSISPVELIEKYGSDAYRYYFMSKCSFSHDGEYSLAHFNEVYNAELANNLGNLASRAGNMVLKNLEGRIPSKDTILKTGALTDVGYNFFTVESMNEWVKATEAFDYRRGLGIVWEILIRANRYFDDRKPWTLTRQPQDEAKMIQLASTLRNTVAMLRCVAILLKPYLPKASERLYNTYDWPVKWQDLNYDHLLEIVKENDCGINDEFRLNPTALVKDENNKSGDIHFLKYPALFPRVVLEEEA